MSNCAGDVARILIPPAVQKRDGRWNFDVRGKQSFEATAASWVIQRLESEGAECDDLWSPDRDRSRYPERRRRPELAMNLDGEPTALDVTTFTSERLSGASARASKAKLEAVDRLLNVKDDREVLATFVYDVDELFDRKKAQFERDIDQLARAFVDALAAPGAVDAALTGLPSWAPRGTIKLVPGRPPPRKVGLYTLRSKLSLDAQIDSFIRSTIGRKGDQMIEWGRGILAIGPSIDEVSADDFKRGFRRVGDPPWWRVYWTGRAPEQLALVAEADRPPSPPV